MAAYGYIVRKFIRYGEVIPEHFSGQAVQPLTVGVSPTLNTADSTAYVSAVFDVPNNGGVASTVFTIKLPYKMRVLPDTRIVPLGATASNVTITIGKSAPIAGATVIAPTVAGLNANITPRVVSTHNPLVETINPFATDAESLTITVLKADPANSAPMRVYMQLAKAD
jgi:hypothetical protein